MRSLSIAVLASLAMIASARAQDTSVPVNALPAASSPAEPATAKSPSPNHPDGSAAPSANASANQAPPLDDEGDGEPSRPLPLQGKLDPRTNSVRVELAKVTAEREHASNLLPWLTLGVGVGSTTLGTIAGAAYAIGCSHECLTHAWVSVVVVAGAAVSTLGAIWLLRIDQDIAEIDSRKYMLERELEHFDQTRLRDDRLYARADPMLKLHF
ncbi:MAG TPA: hypothetical protein VHZ95_01980 [Polyangiales bacterium]|jgi:hypothetical protein|nr:hypothetical protein [Polyangiales bacterium]